MFQEEQSNFIVAGALVILGVVVIAGVLFIRSQAQDVTANIDNAAPAVSIGTAKICPGDTATSNAALSGCVDISSVILTAGAATDVSFVVQVTDANGIDDVHNEATGVLYHDANASPASEACAADNNDCYRRDGECQKVIPTVNSTTAWYRCDYSLQYYADHSDGAPEWLAYLHVTDVGGATDEESMNFEVMKIISGTFPDVEYGFIDLGFQSSDANNIHVPHQNNGNVLLDYIIALDDDDFNGQLDCSTGGIDNTGIRFDRDIAGTPGDLGYSSSKKTITVAPATIEMEIDISQRTNDGAPVGPSSPRSGFGSGGDDVVYSYWSIDVPASGILGSCQEEIDIIAYEQSSPPSVCWLDGVNRAGTNNVYLGLSIDGDFVNVANSSTYPTANAPYAMVDSNTGGYCALSQAGAIDCFVNPFIDSGYPTTGVWVDLEVGEDGDATACALNDIGEIACWGDSNQYNMVSDAPSGSGYKALSVGFHAACAINSDDELECWGGDNSDVLSEMPAGEYLDVACGTRYCIAILLSDGSLVNWGDPLSSHMPVFDDMPVDTGYVYIDAGLRTAGALKDDGSLTFWGQELLGSVSETPTGVESWSTIDVTNAIACGVIIDEGTSGLGDGSLFCWGDGTGVHEVCT